MLSVGKLRAQAAYQDSNTPIRVLVTDRDGKVLKTLKIEAYDCYPDTTNGGEFKILVTEVQ